MKRPELRTHREASGSTDMSASQRVFSGIEDELRALVSALSARDAAIVARIMERVAFIESEYGVDRALITIDRVEDALRGNPPRKNEDV